MKLLFTKIATVVFAKSNHINTGSIVALMLVKMLNYGSASLMEEKNFSNGIE